MKKKHLWLLIMLLIAVLWLAGCSGTEEKAKSASGEGKIKVYTTVYPAYDFTKNVGGDKIEVHNLLPPGTDAHQWEPRPEDMIKVNKADVFIYSLEHWKETILKNTDRSRIVLIDISKGVDLLGDINGHSDDDHRNHPGERADLDSIDPHIWLDPLNARIMVDNITEGLINADPVNKEYYHDNGGKYKEKLSALDREYQSTLSGYKEKKIVVSHDAFGYLARRYGLQQVPVRGLNADVEPSPARMAEIVELIRKNKIDYIFYESLISPKVSETIARETGAKTLVLNPIDGLTKEEFSKGKTYLSIMEENLKNLKMSLEAR